LTFPPKLFNDVTAGGYLTWAEPVAGGVFIDGRLGIDDPEFFAAYMRSLNDPQLWQQEADRLGIQTVLLFHRWQNRQPLIHSLHRSPQWQTVFVDDVAVVFVRAEGNAALIEAAGAQFRTVHAQIAQELLAPVSSWQWPAGRVQALTSYAAVLSLLGHADLA